MRELVTLIIAVGLAFTAKAEDLTKTDLYLKSEPSELFFYPSEDVNSLNWYAIRPCCPEKPPVIHGPSTLKSNLSYKLRPSNATLNAPINTIYAIHKSYSVWARAIWDVVLLEVLYPSFEGKDHANLKLFESRTTPNLIKIRLGKMGEDSDFAFLKNKIDVGELIEVTDGAYRKIGLKEFKFNKFLSKTTYYLVEEPSLRSLSGNPIVIKCSPWPTLGEASQQCEVLLNFPTRYWPVQMQPKFAVTKGLLVSYTFPKVLLPKWKDVLIKTQSFTINLLPELSPEASNFTNLTTKTN